jgi:hypothetical protein
MKTSRLMLVFAMVFCFVASLSYAQDMERKGACNADAEKFCKDVKPGQGRIVNCMQQHETELSPACKDQIAETKEKTREFVKACKTDAEKFCKDVKPGQGRIVRCLKANESALSPDCRKHLKSN